MKYPLIRIEEIFRRDEQTGADVLIQQTAMVADHVLVTLVPGTNESAFKAAVTAGGGSIRALKPASKAYLVTVPAPLAINGLPEAIDALRALPSMVRVAEPDFIVHAALLPNDPSFAQLYGLHNTGQSEGAADADIDAPEAWEITIGSRAVRVGVIDTGIDYTHPDLAANMWTNPAEIAGNGIDDDGNGYIDDVRGWDFVNDDADPTDDHYHGTHCAGTIGGVGNNGSGVAGVNWQVSLIGLKFLSASGFGTTSDAVEAVSYASGLGLDLTSNSWGGGGFSQTLYDAIAAANIAGHLFVAAAGNSARDIDASPNYPSGYDLPNIIAVAATDHADQLAYFSNYGVASVDLAAPGVNTVSTSPGNTYRTLSGTSMATPHVAGAAALLLSRQPGLASPELKAALLNSVDLVPALSGRVLTQGRLNVASALSSLSGLGLSPATGWTVSAQIGGALPATSTTFTLRNGGSSPLSWAASSNVPWADLNLVAGTLAPGATTAVVVSLDTAAAILLPHGTHDGIVTFINAADGAVLRRNVRLVLEPLTVSVFSETFEAASLDSARWTITGGANARAVVSTANVPHGGARHLLMDAAVDGTYARNEATLRLDLAGRSDLRLIFWAKSFNEEPDGPPSSPFLNGADFDGVAISADGGVTWYEIQPLRSLSANWQKYTVDLDAALAARGLAYNANFLIRFNQYDNFSVPTDGIAIDDIAIVRVINKRLGLVSPATIPESGVGTATLTAAPPPDSDLVVALADESSTLTLPATITLSVGQSSVDFTVSSPEDALRNGTRAPVIRATSPGWGPAESVTRVLDNETATLGLSLPASATEGSTAISGTVTVSPAPDTDVAVELSSDDTGELRVPSTTIILAGQTSAAFEMLVVDDNRIDGSTTPSITARIDNWTPASAALAIHDNETRALFVSAPAAVREGAASFNATITLSGTLATPLTVTLGADDTTELAPPAQVVIPAGQLSATATVAIVNDAIQDGPQTVRLTASAPSFAAGETTLLVQDNDAHHLRLSAAPATALRNQAVAFVLSGEDIADQPVPDYSSDLVLGAVDSAGATVPLSPASVAASAFSSGRWTGSVVLGAYATGVRITITDTAGRSVVSAPFDVIAGPAASFVWSNPPPVVTIDTPFNAAVSAVDAAGNPAVSFFGNVSFSVQDNNAGAVRVLSWIGYANTSLSGRYEQTKQAIRNQFTFFTETNTAVTTASALASALVNKDVFLVPVQENDPVSSVLPSFGTAWASVLQDFVRQGGTVIVCSVTGQEHQLLGNSGLLNASKAYVTTGSHPTIKTADTWLNDGVPASFTAYAVSTYVTSNGQTSLMSAIFGYPVVLSRTLGAGRIVLIGTDYAQTGTAMDRVIANAVRANKPPDVDMRAPVRPASATFVAGAWSGALSVPIPGANLSLRADAADLLKGVSAPFAVVPYFASPGTGLVLTVPASVTETEGTATASVAIPSPVTAPVLITLASASPAKLAVPASVTIPAGQTSASFTLTILDDTILDGDRNIPVLATSTDSLVGYAIVRVIDDESGALTLTAPSTISEAASSATATITVTPPAAQPLTIELSSGTPSAATLPVAVVVPPGYPSVTFPITPVNDTAIDGDQITVITATLPGWPAATRSVTITDNEPRALTLAGATSLGEGDAAGLTLSLGGTLAADLVVNLSSADPSQLTVPVAVTIPAGQTSVSFQVQALEDTAQNGGRAIKISASADTFSGAIRDVTVRDDELHHFSFGAIPDGRSTHTPFTITVTALSIDNVALAGYAGPAVLSAQAANGEAVSISPTGTSAFANGVWTGSITATNTGLGVRVTAADDSAAGQSNAFDILSAPRIGVAPSSISVGLHRDESTAREVVISNSGQQPLTWSISGVNAASDAGFANPVLGPVFDGGPERPKDADAAIESSSYEAPRDAGPAVAASWASRLETVLAKLDAGHAAIRGLIPGRYAFTEGATGTNISDGGNDMYDGGNYLATDLGSSLPYSDGVILSSVALGSGGRYFTRKYDGLFVFAADLAGVSYFEITGNLGADGSGSTDTAILAQTRGGVTYRGFVKRVYGAGDPSVNHLVIVADNGSVAHSASTDTNSDQHRVSSLSGVTRVYYLLYAGGSGGYINNTSAQSIMSAFLDVATGGDWMSGAPASGTIAPGASATVTLTFDSTALEFRTHTQTLRVASNDPLQPATDIPVSLTVTDRVLHHFAFDPVPAQIRGAPFTVRLRALASDGLPVILHAAPVALSANGATLTPSTTTAQGWAEGVWTGQTTVTTFGTGITLAANDGAGHAGLSNAFDVGTGPAAGLKWDTVLSSQVVDTPFPAVLRAVDAGGNPVSTHSGAVALSALVPQALAKTGADYSTDNYPFAASYGAVVRQQLLYPAASLGGNPRRLISLALNVTATNPVASFSQWTIRLKHSTRTTLSGALFDADGWSTVHVSTATPTATGWVVFGFTSPFDYNGTDALLVDFSFRNSTTGSANVSTAVSYDSTIRSIKQASASASADPFAFSSPSTFSYLSPIMRFYSLESTPLRPSGATLTNGVWSGDVSLATPGSPILLRAIASGPAFTGTSNTFTVSSPAISTPLPFTETWESGAASTVWTLGGTNSYRNQITTGNAPHGGTRHLTLDSTSLSPFSRNEATLTLDLAGCTGVVLSFWAKGFNEDANAPGSNPFTGGADFDGVAISADGATWHEVQPLRSPALTNAWQLFTVNLDSALATRGLAYTSAFRIRFNRYGNDYIPYDGIAIDDISVTTSPTGITTLALPITVSESAAPLSGTLSIAASRPTDTVFTLASSGPAKLALPGTVTLPAGQTSVAFAATPINDTIFDGTRTVAITAAPPPDAGLFKGIATILITDDDAPAITLSVTPSSVAEGASAATAIVTLGAAPAAAISLELASSDPSAATVPPFVAFEAGQTTATFPVTPVNDTKIDGPQVTTLSASLPGASPGTASFIVTDNETTTLGLSIGSSIQEGSSGSGTVSISGTLPDPLVVSLSSANPAQLTVPATVTIPAGSTSASFTATAVDDTDTDGSKYVQITAAAPGFTSSTATPRATDNDLHHFSFSTVSSGQIANRPFSVYAYARTIDDDGTPVISRSVSLSAQNADGAVLVTPASLTFSSSAVTASITVQAPAAGVTLRLDDGAGHTGSSNSFDVGVGAAVRFGVSSLPSYVAVGVPAAVTVAALDAYGNRVSTFAGAAGLGVAPVISTTGHGIISGRYYPFASSVPTSRTQALYTPAEVGLAGRFSSLGLRFVVMPGQALDNFTIRLKHAPSSVPSEWEPDGWTTVYQGSVNLVAASPGWIRFPFTTPFDYDGVSHLMVDLSFRNGTSTFARDGVVETTNVGSNRVLYRSTYENYGYGSPLLWSGSTPYGNADDDLPNLQLIRSGASVPVSPVATGAFTAGAWTGNVTFGAASVEPVALQASQDALFGQSDPFAVVDFPAPVLQPVPPVTGGASNTLIWTPVPEAVAYEAQAGSTADFTAPLGSGWTDAVRHTFAPLSEGPWSYRVRARMPLFDFGKWRQSEVAEFASDQLAQVDATTAPGEVRLARLPYVHETFDQATAWSGTAFPDVGAGTFTLAALTSPQGPNTAPPLPINQGGDKEAVIAGASASALTAGTPIVDGAIDAYLRPGNTTGRIGVLLRASRVNGQLTGYMVSFLTFGGSFQVDVHRIANGARTWIGGYPSLYYYTADEHYRLRFAAESGTLQVQFWKVAMVNGTVTETLIKYGSGDRLTITDGTVSAAGQFGLYAEDSGAGALFEDVRITTPALDRYAASGTLVSTPISPDPLLGWGRFSNDSSISADTSISFDVLDAESRLLASDISSQTKLSDLPALASAPAIRLRARLASTAPASTPILRAWSIDWRREISGHLASPWSPAIASVQDVTAPSLVITSAPVSSTASYVLSGTATDANGVTSLAIDGKPASTANAYATWSRALTLHPGVNVLSLLASDPADPANVRATTFNVAYTPPDLDADGLPDTWETAHGLDESSSTSDHGRLGDPDRDGVPNLLEYAMGLDPRAAEARPSTSSAIATHPESGRSHLVFTYRRLIHPGLLTYTVTMSSNLVAWAAPDTAPEVLSTVANSDGLTETVTLRIHPALDAGRVFVRVQVDAP